MKDKVRIFLLFVTVFAFGCRTDLQPGDDKFISEEEIVEADYNFFHEPPVIYKPQTWFHFISGNVALQGVRSDIKAISEAGFSGTIRFRSTGKAELWDPVTGKITDAKVIKNEDNSTCVEVTLPPSGSVFIVFKAGKRVSGTDENKLLAKKVLPVNGRWKIEFPGGWGAPDSLITDSLKPWKELNLSDEAKAFSGTATYKTGFILDLAGSPKQVMLDLAG